MVNLFFQDSFGAFTKNKSVIKKQKKQHKSLQVSKKYSYFETNSFKVL
jgi:hypothetical protein